MASVVASHGSALTATVVMDVDAAATPAAAGAGSDVSAAAPVAAVTPAFVEVAHLNFDYGAGSGFRPILRDVTFSLPRGEGRGD
jgi:hypothetical protein